jgi:hypothetical protein
MWNLVHPILRQNKTRRSNLTMVCHGFSLLDQVRRQEGLHEHLQDTWHMSIMGFFVDAPSTGHPLVLEPSNPNGI